MAKEDKLDLGEAPESANEGRPGWDYLSDDASIRCVFSTVRKVKMGMGANSRTHESRIYYYVEQMADGSFEVREINDKNVPTGDGQLVPLHKLLNDYRPELAYYEQEVLPATAALDDILKQGDGMRKGGRYYSAELEYDRALDIETKNVRALFGLGLIYAGRNEADRTRGLLTELVDLKATFEGKNQHLFNEFGIALRKAGLFNEAVVYYQRALAFTRKDENLYYNLARAHYENNDWDGCLENLVISNRLNPDLGVTKDMFKVIIGLAEDEKLLNTYAKPPVPQRIVTRARQILAAERAPLALDEGPLQYVPRGRARSGLDAVLTDLDILDD